MKRNFDRKFGVKDKDIKVDDLVLYRRPRGKIFDKMEPVRDPKAWRVEEVKGTMVTACSDQGERVTRNSSCFKNLSIDSQSKSIEESSQVKIPGRIQEDSNQGLRRSSRSNQGKIDKLQINFDSKSYVKK